MICATSIHACELAMDFSQSLANRRQRLSHAKVRSTTHLLGMTSKPSAVSPTSITNGGAGSTWHLPDFSYTSAALRLSKWQPAKMSERLDFVLVQRAGARIKSNGDC